MNPEEIEAEIIAIKSKFAELFREFRDFPKRIAEFDAKRFQAFSDLWDNRRAIMDVNKMERILLEDFRKKLFSQRGANAYSFALDRNYKSFKEMLIEFKNKYFTKKAREDLKGTLNGNFRSFRLDRTPSQFKNAIKGLKILKGQVNSYEKRLVKSTIEFIEKIRDLASVLDSFLKDFMDKNNAESKLIKGFEKPRRTILIFRRHHPSYYRHQLFELYWAKKKNVDELFEYVDKSGVKLKKISIELEVRKRIDSAILGTILAAMFAAPALEIFSPLAVQTYNKIVSKYIPLLRKMGPQIAT